MQNYDHLILLTWRALLVIKQIRSVGSSWSSHNRRQQSSKTFRLERLYRTISASEGKPSHPFFLQFIQTKIYIYMQQDHNCSICLQLFFNPVQLNCKHIFCFECLAGVDKRICPNCRQEFNMNEIQYMEQYEKKLSELFPDVMKQRTEQQEKEQNLKFFLIYGNEHVNFDDLHHWTVFVKLSHSTQLNKQFIEEPDEIIEQVTFTLIPTYPFPKITITEPPFSIKRVGFEPFKIKIQIQFKTQYMKSSKEIEFLLNFDVANSQKMESIMFKRIAFD
ncbi:hypothetical protein pb186bvf_018200 [Paramecium bursaria]